MTDAVSKALEKVAQRLEQAVVAHDLGQITTEELLRRAASHVEQVALAVKDRVANEVAYDYARLLISEIAVNYRDYLLPEVFDALMAESSTARRARAAFENYVADLDHRLLNGERQKAIVELIEVCRSGNYTHRLAVAQSGVASLVLRLAHDRVVPEALVEAVSPRWYDHSRLTDAIRTPQTWRLAWDLLAHLAAEPGTDAGASARDGLVRLCDFLDTAGEASVRLPVHLLNSRQRSELLTAHERRVELLADGQFRQTVSLREMRDDRVFRSVVWQVFDARTY